ncbi:hypothetical protein ScPMuIL_017949 [Solemya velum]
MQMTDVLPTRCCKSMRLSPENKVPQQGFRDGDNSLHNLLLHALARSVSRLNSNYFFSCLHPSDQTTLLKAAWREICLLGAAYSPIDFSLHFAVHTSKMSDNEKKDADAIRRIHDAVVACHSLNADPVELWFMDTIMFLRPDIGNLVDSGKVRTLRDRAQVSLRNYLSKAQAHNPARFGQVLLLLPILCAVAGDVESIVVGSDHGKNLVSKLLNFTQH